LNFQVQVIRPEAQRDRPPTAPTRHCARYGYSKDEVSVCHSPDTQSLMPGTCVAVGMKAN